MHLMNSAEDTERETTILLKSGSGILIVITYPLVGCVAIMTKVTKASCPRCGVKFVGDTKKGSVV